MPQFRRLAPLLTLLALSGGRANELPLRMGPFLPGQPLSTPAVCPPPDNRFERVLHDLYTHEQPELTCGNAFVDYPRTPRGPGTPQDAFDTLAAQVRAARSEVLLANMEWNAGPGQPGGTFVGAVADLYRAVRADPARYPQGMAVRVLLGNYPQLTDPDGSAQPRALARDLLSRGVPFEDPAVGWQLTLLNYRFLPHSHVKLEVIDGREVTVAGYNFSAWHLPVAEGGRGLHDLGLRLRGPVAQRGVAAFDDLWRHSRQWRCEPSTRPDEVDARCAPGAPDPPRHPDAARVAAPAGESRAYLLYRRPGVDLADRAHLALLGAAQQELEVMHADFAPTVECWYAYLNPETCGPDTWPVYLRAVLDAAERGVRVRLLTVDYGFGAPGNRSGVALVRRELRRRGLEDLFEARYTTFPMHTKALTVDGALVVAGSMNFHFSAWGPWGLAEAAVATGDPRAVQAQEQSFAAVWASGSRPVPQERWLPNIPRDLAPGGTLVPRGAN